MQLTQVAVATCPVQCGLLHRVGASAIDVRACEDESLATHHAYEAVRGDAPCV